MRWVTRKRRAARVRFVCPNVSNIVPTFAYQGQNALSRVAVFSHLYVSVLPSIASGCCRLSATSTIMKSSDLLVRSDLPICARGFRTGFRLY